MARRVPGVPGPSGGRVLSPEPGEFVLPYEAAARENPGQVLLEFLQSTYEAAANCASWDRAALQRHG